MSGYDWRADEFVQLLLQSYYPERTTSESAIIRDYLKAHLTEFDRVQFSVRIGKGLAPDPSHLPGVQRNTVYSTQKRIDVVGWFGRAATLIEAKTHVSHEVLGQLLSDRHIWLEDYPDAPEPRLVAIGRSANEDVLRVLSASGIDVYLYALEATS